MKKPALSLWAGFAVMAILLHGYSFLNSLRPEPGEAMDFFQEWSSAKNWQLGLPIYERLDVAAAAHLGQPVRPGYQWLFARNPHPPAAVLLALPFGALSYPNAMLTWNLLSLLAVGLACWLIARTLRIALHPWMVMPTIVILLLWNPLRQQVYQGQLNGILAVLLVGGWSACVSGRERLGGGLFGVATAIKLFPGMVLVAYLLRRRWNVLLGASVSLGTLTVLAAVVLGPSAYRDYISNVLPATSTYLGIAGNITVAGVWEKWWHTGALHMDGVLIPPLISSPMLATAGYAVSFATIVLAWARRVIRGTQDAAIGLTLTTMVLLSPVAWDHYIVLLVLPIVQLLRHFREPHWEWYALVASLVSASINPATFEFAKYSDRVLSLTTVSVTFVGVLGLFVLGLRFADQTTNRDTFEGPCGSSM